MKKEDLITLEASSPEELTQVLESLQRKNTKNCLYSALALSDPECIIYPFTFNQSNVKDVQKQIRDEIATIFLIPIFAIEYDFQIFVQEDNYISGICAAITKKRLYEYLRILDSNKLAPLRIIPYSAAIGDYYFHIHKNPDFTFALIDFSKRHLVSIAVFKKDKCELLRQLPYEYLHDVEPEIKESMKNACILSGIERLDRIHFAGTLEDKMDIVQDIEALFPAKIERDHGVDVVTALSVDDHYFDVNLARNYTFSAVERDYADKISTMLMVLCSLVVIFLGIQIVLRVLALKKVYSSYTASEYDYAINLKKEMDLL